jgi:hypothetical protein
MGAVASDGVTRAEGGASPAPNKGVELARLRHQTAPQRKRFRVQRDCLLAVPQPFVVEIQVKRVKYEAVRDLHTVVCSCAPAAPGQRCPYYGRRTYSHGL